MWPQAMAKAAGKGEGVHALPSGRERKAGRHTEREQPEANTGSEGRADEEKQRGKERRSI